MFKSISPNSGVIIACIIILLWSICLISLLRLDLNNMSPWIFLMVFIQMHLYTGLFITAHDAMHGTISKSKNVNFWVGQLCTALYAAFSYKKLYMKHHQHHNEVHSELDPDYHSGHFFSWYLKFMRTYLSWGQILIMAIVFNVLKLWVDEVNLVVFWVMPAFLSTMQLFYFGTWLPHNGNHNNIHHSRTQKKNHIYAFFSCYFFGYHYEHHDAPHVPWWRLWQLK